MLKCQHTNTHQKNTHTLLHQKKRSQKKNLNPHLWTFSGPFSTSTAGDVQLRKVQGGHKQCLCEGAVHFRRATPSHKHGLYDIASGWEEGEGGGRRRKKERREGVGWSCQRFRTTELDCVLGHTTAIIERPLQTREKWTDSQHPVLPGVS